MALGSTTQRVFALIMKEGVWITLAGVALGLAGARALRGLMAHEVYGIEPMDPVVLGSVLAGVATVALAACLLPALKASRVNPVEVVKD